MKITDNFVKKLSDNTQLLINDDPTSPPNFSSFLLNFSKLLDETCKLDKPKTSVRNVINNPWKTDGIILAIANKDNEGWNFAVS